MKQISRTVFAIVAALIGAGFASGQEIKVFFYSHGIKGVFGLVCCGILMIYIIYQTLKIAKNKNINSYKDFVYILVGNNRKREYFNIGFIINTIVNLFLIVTFFIMIAGFGAYFAQEFSISSYIGSGILSVLCFITLVRKSKGVIKINSILMPVLILSVVSIGMINIKSIDFNLFIDCSKKVNALGWLVDSIVYCSYNSILLIPLLITLKKYILKDKYIGSIALISGGLIFVLAITIYFLLARIEIDINTLEMPIAYVIRENFSNITFIYTFIILASIYTTAISIGMSLLENIGGDDRRYVLLSLILCLVGFIVSGLGFSNLISLLYPVFGYLGLIQIIALVRQRVRQRGRFQMTQKCVKENRPQ